MATLAAVVRDELPVHEIKDGDKRTLCERLLVALNRDFATCMPAFCHANPSARLDIGKACFLRGTSLLRVPIDNVQTFEHNQTRRELAELGASLVCIHHQWYLTVALAEPAPEAAFSLWSLVLTLFIAYIAYGLLTRNWTAPLALVRRARIALKM
jgi:hypothetical protein